MEGQKKVCNVRLNGSLMNGGQHRSSVKDEELRRLEREIRKAYMTKALHAQLAEQEADRLAARIQSRVASEIDRCAAVAEHEKLDNLEVERLARRTGELKVALERQMEEKRVERQQIEVEEREERRLLVELDRVREEREADEKLRLREDLAEQFLLQDLVQREIREINQCQLEEQEAAEDEKNLRYVRALESRAADLRRVRSEALKRREEAVETVARLLLEASRTRKERRQLLLDLAVEEARFAAEMEARAADARRRERSHEVAHAQEEQMRFEEECRRRFMEREREFAEAVMAKVMESEVMERLSAETRRRRRTEYRQELEELMRERERVRAEELVKLRVALEEERRKEEVDREEARKARMQLLERHVEHIGDFMSGKSLYAEEQRIVEDSRRKM